ncbi:2'-5' RNA ligase family protein [Sphingomonas sp.]|uniref:2'-5' RNA ligase family protein n=1 Tax=Sphingomonas sp. TaxID=28214 RepID=UPI0035BC2A9F
MFHHPPTLHRLFFGLRPPPSLAGRIAAGAAYFDPVRGLAAERLHITLFILADLVQVPPGLLHALHGVGASIDCGPVQMALDVAHGSSRAVALRPARRDPALAALRARIADEARAHGLAERAGYRFAPHMTLGYGDVAPFSRAIAPVGWTADELVLIDSQVGRTRHHMLGRWPLDGGEGGGGGGQLRLF